MVKITTKTFQILFTLLFSCGLPVEILEEKSARLLGGLLPRSEDGQFSLEIGGKIGYNHGDTIAVIGNGS